MISSGAGEGSSGGPGAAGQAIGGLKKGPWTASEDEILIQYVQKHGEGNWNAVQKQSRLNRCGKSCRLRWANHLRPNLKKGSFTPDEENLILELHSKYGNKWARMATHLPGRTDNEIKNYWNTRVKRRKRQGLPLYPNEINQHNQQQQLPSPSGLTNATPTPPTTPTPTNFPFHNQPIQFQSNINNNNNNNLFDPAQGFSFQYRPVPLLATPLTRLKSPYTLPHGGHTPLPFTTYSGASGFENCGIVSPGSVNVKTELPLNQYHHQQHHQHQHQHQHHHEILHAPNVNDFLETLIDNGHMSVEGSSDFLPKEEAKEHMNSLPDDLSKLVFVPSGGASFQPSPVAPAHHWYNSHVSTGDFSGDFSGDMQHLAATFFPVMSPSTTTTTASTTDYSQNPTSWETLPGIGKGWFKNA